MRQVLRYGRMAARWGIVVGIAAIAGGIAWFALHDRGSPDAAKVSATPEGSGRLTATTSGSSSGSAVGSAGRDGKIAFDTTARPTSTQPPPSPPSGEKFEAEQRDPDWAPGVGED